MPRSSSKQSFVCFREKKEAIKQLQLSPYRTKTNRSSLVWDKNNHFIKNIFSLQNVCNITSSMAVIPNLFFGLKHPIFSWIYLAVLLDVLIMTLIGIKIKKMWQLVAPQAATREILLCCGTPVGNHSLLFRDNLDSELTLPFGQVRYKYEGKGFKKIINGRSFYLSIQSVVLR